MIKGHELEFNYSERRYYVRLDCGCKFNFSEQDLMDYLQKNHKSLNQGFYILNCYYRYIYSVHSKLKTCREYVGAEIPRKNRSRP